jgi:hypothetical protein
VVGGHEKGGVLTRRRLGSMVEALDLEEMVARNEKLRTGSAIIASTVENTSVLGLGFNPNQHNKEKKTKKRPSDPVQEKQEDEPSDAG